MTTCPVACSCGVAGCRELAWPHEWDPIAAGDECGLGYTADLTAFAIGGPDPRNVVLDVTGVVGALLDHRHLVRVPYVRHGSGYACASCAATGDGRS